MGCPSFMMGMINGGEFQQDPHRKYPRKNNTMTFPAGRSTIEIKVFFIEDRTRLCCPFLAIDSEYSPSG